MMEAPPSSTAPRSRRTQVRKGGEGDNEETAPLHSARNTPTAVSSFHTRRSDEGSFRQCLRNVLAGRSNRSLYPHPSGTPYVIARRVASVLWFVLVYGVIYSRLGTLQRYDPGYEAQPNRPHHYQPQVPRKNQPSTPLDTHGNRRSTDNRANQTLAYYLNAAPPKRGNRNGIDAVSNPSLEEARKGRERIVSILEDAGIHKFDAQDVLRLPLWSSISELYYNNNNNNREGPVILGLEGCARFRERVPVKERFLGVAGSFNSGTTAFGISLQNNCRLLEHDPKDDFVVFKRRDVFATNVNGILSQVPWAKHKTADYRHGTHTILPPHMAPIDHDHVLPIVLVRDPWYWMQSMCKEGYGVRWDHDSKHHCPNLVPNEFDRQRFPKLTNASVPVWMGPNPTAGPSWPSLIHYWNAWYESYFNNRDAEDVGSSSTWPRLVIRFEDTLFQPRRVMEQVCGCGGGILRDPHDYSLEESKPHHKHERKNNFVTAMMQYGTNATRLRNMTEDDVRFAAQNLNPTLMKAFGYSYPDTTKPS